MNQEVVTIVATLAASIALPWVAEYFNNLWNLDGPKALSLVMLLSLIVATGALFLSGDLSFANFTIENFAATAGLIFTATQVVFQVFKDTLFKKA